MNIFNNILRPSSSSSSHNLPRPNRTRTNSALMSNSTTVTNINGLVNNEDCSDMEVGSDPSLPEMQRSVSTVGKNEVNASFSLRLTPFIDHSSSSPALYFSPVIRKIKPGSAIPMGRYTEKSKPALQAPQGSSASVVFKSKVVSRVHAEFSVGEDGSWFIKDLCSSSGTFLNHLRLSQAGTESERFPITDGDILQLGMDFRGGTEEIFRCVKMRVELNKSWSRRGAKFSKETSERLKALSLLRPDEEVPECAICLLRVEPCQAVFVSPCSHSWHYKCIRPLVIKSYPQFLCPNCRAMCDLEADLESEEE